MLKVRNPNARLLAIFCVVLATIAAASEFKGAPTGLTMLARKNNGKFPEDQVYATLKVGTNAPAHGNLQMPIWVDLFRSTSRPNKLRGSRISFGEA